MLIFIYANCSGFSREFRVVRDNRVNHIYKEVKPPSQQQPTSTTEKLPVNTSEKGYVLIVKFTVFGWGLVDFPIQFHL
jgi:hypothetical protein